MYKGKKRPYPFEIHFKTSKMADIAHSSVYFSFSNNSVVILDSKLQQAAVAKLPRRHSICVMTSGTNYGPAWTRTMVMCENLVILLLLLL